MTARSYSQSTAELATVATNFITTSSSSWPITQAYSDDNGTKNANYRAAKPQQVGTVLCQTTKHVLHTANGTGAFQGTWLLGCVCYALSLDAVLINIRLFASRAFRHSKLKISPHKHLKITTHQILPLWQSDIWKQFSQKDKYSRSDRKNHFVGGAGQMLRCREDRSVTSTSPYKNPISATDKSQNYIQQRVIFIRFITHCTMLTDADYQTGSLSCIKQQHSMSQTFNRQARLAGRQKYSVSIISPQYFWFYHNEATKSRYMHAHAMLQS